VNGGGPPPDPAPLLIATFNPGKAREIAAFLAARGFAAVTPAERGLREPFEERGETYEENALGKARHCAALSGLAAIGDDSGIEVEALGGRPGPRSARYGGAGLDDAARCRLLLRELEGVPLGGRAARYVAILAIARPDGATMTFRGSCEGRIAVAPRGPGGFGYDPLFFYPPLGATFAEVTRDQKERVSHRGIALVRLAEFLGSDEGRRFLGSATRG
jgi:XTP/dITP diphosphohydrolase